MHVAGESATCVRWQVPMGRAGHGAARREEHARARLPRVDGHGDDVWVHVGRYGGGGGGGALRADLHHGALQGAGAPSPARRIVPPPTCRCFVRRDRSLAAMGAVRACRQAPTAGSRAHVRRDATLALQCGAVAAARTGARACLTHPMAVGASDVHEQKKPWVPLMLQPSYRPSGWLGIMCVPAAAAIACD